MYRTVTDGPDGYVYGEWTTRENAFDQARSITSDLAWVEDSLSNRVTE
jgi:hypothetical protein